MTGQPLGSSVRGDPGSPSRADRRRQDATPLRVGQDTGEWSALAEVASLPARGDEDVEQLLERSSQ